MKRTVSATLAVLMLLCCLPLFALTASAVSTQPAAPPNDGEIMFVTAENTSEYTSHPNEVASCKNYAIDVGGKKLIKMENIAAGLVSLLLQPAGIIDATGMSWLEFYLDITEWSPDNTYYFILRGWDGLGACFDSYGGSNLLEYRYLVNGEWEENKVDEYGRIAIPANFAGYVRFDFNLLMESISNMQGNGSAPNPAFLSELLIWSDGADEVGKSIYWNDFKFIKDNSKIEEVEVKPDEKDPPVQAAAPANSGETVFLNADNNQISTKGVPSEISIITSGGKNMFKLRNGKSPTGDQGFTCITSVNASGKQYLEFWVDVSQSFNDVSKIVTLLFDANGAVADIRFSDEKVDYYLLIDGVWEKNTVANGGINLPAGFSGYVRVDMAQYVENGIGHYIGNGNNIDPASITSIDLWYPLSESSKYMSVYFNDFKFVSDKNMVIKPDEVSDTDTDITEAPSTDKPESPDTGANIIAAFGFALAAGAVIILSCNNIKNKKTGK